MVLGIFHNYVTDLHLQRKKETAFFWLVENLQPETLNGGSTDKQLREKAYISKPHY